MVKYEKKSIDTSNYFASECLFKNSYTHSRFVKLLREPRKLDRNYYSSRLCPNREVRLLSRHKNWNRRVSNAIVHENFSFKRVVYVQTNFIFRQNSRQVPTIISVHLQLYVYINLVQLCYMKVDKVIIIMERFSFGYIT